MAADDTSMQLINGKGEFDASGLEAFVRTVELAERETSYVVVSIMGPQSSGKSTLLNLLFGTEFKEMDSKGRRKQTTQGIWLAKCKANIEPFTMVMDVEGCDGQERGEDDTAFERQSALFALAVSDIVMINMWYKDIGRSHAANKPLLRIVFQAMIKLKLCRKSTLVFVIRDASEDLADETESDLKNGIKKIWDEIVKPQDFEGIPLSDVFCVEVVFLLDYKYRFPAFMEKVESLRQKFCDSIKPNGLAGERGEVIPASGFAFSAQEIWKVIKEDKDLDLPAHKVMVARIRCEELADVKFATFIGNPDWNKLEIDVQRGMVPGFGDKLNAMLDECLSGYDTETKYFDEDVRTSKKELLLIKLLQIVRPAYDSIVGHIRSKTLSEFKEAFAAALGKGKEGFADAARKYTQQFLSEFDERVKQDAVIKHVDWNPSEIRDILAREMDDHVTSVRATKFNELAEIYKRHLSRALSTPVTRHLDKADDGTWPAIKELFEKKTESSIKRFSELGFDQATTDKMTQELRDHARKIVKNEAKSAANNVLAHMKNRFSLFYLDEKRMARKWRNKNEVESTSRTVVAACAKMLSVRAALRLDNQTDTIESIISSALAGDASSPLLNSKTWPEVSRANTLISPPKCKSLLLQFKNEAEPVVAKAIEEAETKRMVSNILTMGATVLLAGARAPAAVALAAAPLMKKMFNHDAGAEPANSGILAVARDVLDAAAPGAVPLIEQIFTGDQPANTGLGPPGVLPVTDTVADDDNSDADIDEE